MDAVSSKSRRPIIVEFLATLFVTFLIGVATSIVLCACVILMAGEARGAEFMSLNASVAACGNPGEEIRAKVDELVTAHRLATQYASPVAVDRMPATAVELEPGDSAFPARLPQGGSCEAVFGGAPQAGAAPDASDSRLKLLAGTLSLLFAALLFMQARSNRETRLGLWHRRRS